MKRIIPISLYLLLVIPAGLYANVRLRTRANSIDTSSNRVARAADLILTGNFSTIHAAYGRNYFDLNWNTVTGDFHHFEIERSFDGQKYETIGTVNKSPEVSSEGQFSFRDHFRVSVALNNDFYYRLKQIDGKGNIIYSKVLIARMFNTRSLASLSITPDPLANDILVNVQLRENSYVVMRVTDEQGNLLLKEGRKAENGSNTYTLEGTHNLHPGLYTLEVTVNSKERMVMKLAKS